MDRDTALRAHRSLLANGLMLGDILAILAGAGLSYVMTEHGSREHIYAASDRGTSEETAGILFRRALALGHSNAENYMLIQSAIRRRVREEKKYDERYVIPEEFHGVLNETFIFSLGETVNEESQKKQAVLDQLAAAGEEGFYINERLQEEINRVVGAAKA